MICKWVSAISEPRENVCFRLSAKMSDFGDSQAVPGCWLNLRVGIGTCSFWWSPIIAGLLENTSQAEFSLDLFSQSKHEILMQSDAMIQFSWPALCRKQGPCFSHCGGSRKPHSVGADIYIRPLFLEQLTFNTFNSSICN